MKNEKKSLNCLIFIFLLGLYGLKGYISMQHILFPLVLSLARQNDIFIPMRQKKQGKCLCVLNNFIPLPLISGEKSRTADALAYYFALTEAA